MSNAYLPDGPTQLDMFRKTALLKAPVKRIGGPFNPVPFSKPLENGHITDSKKIAAAAIALVKE